MTETRHKRRELLLRAEPELWFLLAVVILLAVLLLTLTSGTNT
jgi:hypothetical protein